MKIVLYKYLCGKCHASFKAPGISGELYGEFLMWSEKAGTVVYLNAINDPTFNEVEIIFDKINNAKPIPGYDNTDVFQSIFSESCDLAEDGSPYRIGLNPICPNCNSREIESRSMVIPIEYTDYDVAPVTHVKWNKISNSEKEKKIRDAIKSLHYNL